LIKRKIKVNTEKELDECLRLKKIILEGEMNEKKDNIKIFFENKKSITSYMEFIFECCIFCSGDIDFIDDKIVHIYNTKHECKINMYTGDIRYRLISGDFFEHNIINVMEKFCEKYKKYIMVDIEFSDWYHIR